MKKILFDTQAFQYLILQAKHHDRFQQLKHLIKKSDILVFGNITFLKELIGLSSKNILEYKKVLNEYRIITNQKLLRPYNDLLRMEIEARAPLKQNDIFFSDRGSKDIYDKLQNNIVLQALDEFIYANKQNNLLIMKKANKLVKERFSNNNKIRREIKTEANKWLKDFGANIQSWGESIFNSSGEINFEVLPHSASFITYLLTILHQTAMSGQIPKGSDEYDRQHITEAAAVDVFITEDIALIQMYNQIPDRYRFVQVKNINDLFAMIS